jgi:hypothetical protein
VLDVKLAIAFVVPMHEPVDHDLADRFTRVVLDLELNSGGSV